jgi:hypothetical protein
MSTPYREHDGVTTPGFFSRLFSSAKKARVMDSTESTSTSMESNFDLIPTASPRRVNIPLKAFVDENTGSTMKISSMKVDVSQSNEWRHHAAIANFSIGTPSEKNTTFHQPFNRRRRVPTRPQSYTLVGRPRRRPVPKEWNPSDFDHILQSNKSLFLRPDEDDVASLTLPLGTKRLMGTNQSASRLIHFTEKETNSIVSTSGFESSADVQKQKVSFTEISETPSAFQTKLKRQQTPAINQNQMSTVDSNRSADMPSDYSSLQKITTDTTTFEIPIPLLPRTDFNEEGPYIFDGDKELPPVLQNFKQLVPFPTLRKPKSFPGIAFTYNERFVRRQDQEVKENLPQKTFTTDDDEVNARPTSPKKNRTGDLTWGAHMFQTNKWQCDSCKVFNEQNLTCCVACETIRPKSKDKNVSSLVSKDTEIKPATKAPPSVSFGVVSSMQTTEAMKGETRGFSFGIKSDPASLSTTSINSSLKPDTSNQNVNPALKFSFGVISQSDSGHKQPNVAEDVIDSSTRKDAASSALILGSQDDSQVSKNVNVHVSNNPTITFPMTFTSENSSEGNANRIKQDKDEAHSIKKSVGFSFGVSLPSNPVNPSITASSAPPSFSFGSTTPSMKSNTEESSSEFAEPKSDALKIMSVKPLDRSLDQTNDSLGKYNSASLQESSTTFKFGGESKLPEKSPAAPSFIFGKPMPTETTVDKNQNGISEHATKPTEDVLPSSTFSFGTSSQNLTLPSENKSLVRFGVVEESTPAPKFSFGTVAPDAEKKSSVSFADSQREIKNTAASTGPSFTFGLKPETLATEIPSKSSVTFAITPKANEMTTRFTFGSTAGTTNGDSSAFGMTTPGPSAANTNIGTVTPAPAFSFGMSTPAIPTNSSTLFAGSTPAPVNFGGGSFTPGPTSNSFLAGSTPGPLLFGGVSTSASAPHTFLAGSTPAPPKFGDGTLGVNFGSFQGPDNNSGSSASVTPAFAPGSSSFESTTISSTFAASSTVPSLSTQTTTSSFFGNQAPNSSFGSSNALPSVSFGATSTFGGPAPASTFGSSFAFGTAQLPSSNVSFGGTSAPSNNFGANSFGHTTATPTPSSGGFTIGSSSKSTGRRIVRAKRPK